MGWFSRKAAPVEQRSVQVAQSSQSFFELIGVGGQNTASGIAVTVDSALSVPAIFAAVNFISGTFAGLPLNLFQRDGDKRQKVSGTPLAVLLHDAVNDELSSFEWRKSLLGEVLTGGRSCTFIERNGAGTITNLWPLDPTKVTVKRGPDGRKTYEYRPMSASVLIYSAAEIIDIPFMLKSDGLGHRGPVATNKDVIALSIAATRFGSRFFQNGGVPPFAITGKFQSGQAMARAAEDLATAVKKAAKEERQALMLPEGLDIKSIGIDAEKSQLVELKRFLTEEFARIYSIPPTFLQDLSNGTFSNTEQQDLHFVKHTIKRWVEAFEQELNLKLFGRGKREFFVEMNMDGLLRGDFKTRMEGYSVAIQTAQMTPNEARRLENRPDDPAGDVLLVQGATVPVAQQINGGAGPQKDGATDA